jgi:addiction module HigA family antidote
MINGASVSLGPLQAPKMLNLLTTTRKETRMAKAHAPIHPGEILLDEFLVPYGVSQYELAKVIGVSARRINEIVHGTRGISADTALRLARAFDISDRFWLNLQNRYDLEVEKDRLEEQLAGIKVLPAVAQAS